MAIATARPIGLRPPRRRLWESREAFLVDLVVAIFGLAGAFSINLVGSFPGNELLVLPLLPLLLLYRGNRAFKREYFWFYVLVAGWLLGTIVADIYTGSPMVNRMKGTARVVFFALNFMALASLVGNNTRRVVIFIATIAIVMFRISLAFREDTNIMWKFGLGNALAVAILFISAQFYARKKYWICVLISIGLAALNLNFGFRSQVVVHLVSAVLLIPLFDKSLSKPGGSRSRQATFQVLLLAALAGGAAFSANALIKYAAESGFFDESLQLKFEQQAAGDYGVLVGGRPETLVALQAIRDSPILGHGSYPVDRKYLELRQDIQYEHGYSDTDQPEDQEYPVIPTHSHLTMAWVESGILGGICWIYLLVLTLRGIFALGYLRPNLMPLYCYLLVGFVWDILYSPFGSVNRLWAAFFILLSYNILAQAAEQKRSSLPRRRVIYQPNRRALRLSGAM
jgi:O-antigen ligase